MDKQTQKLAVSPGEAAEMIGVSVRTIHNLIKKKRLAARKIGRRTVLLVDDLQAFLNSSIETPLSHDRAQEIGR